MFHSVIESMGSAPTAGVSPDSSSPVVPLTDADQGHSGPAGGVRDGVLYFQRCRWCRTPVVRRLLCPACGSTDFAEERSDGVGTIQSVTVVGRAVGKPRAMATIDMHEGFRLRARVSAYPVSKAHVGAQVRLGFGPRPQEIVFHLCDD
jgi:uncharacterized OB-fold protein